MKNTKWFVRMMVLIGMSFALSATAQNELMDANLADPNVQNGNIVDVNIAKVAAADRLPVFYAGEWDYFTHFVLYDLIGEPAAYTKQG